MRNLFLVWFTIAILAGCSKDNGVVDAGSWNIDTAEDNSRSASSDTIQTSESDANQSGDSQNDATPDINSASDTKTETETDTNGSTNQEGASDIGGDTHQDTESDALTKTDIDSDGCTFGRTECRDSRVYRCENGIFSLWDDCVIQGRDCGMIQGAAACVIAVDNLDSDTGTDSTTNTDSRAATDTNNNVSTDTSDNVATDTSNTVPTDTNSNLRTDTSNSVATDTIHNVATDTIANDATDTNNNVPTDTSNSVATDTIHNIATDTIANVATDTASNTDTGNDTDTNYDCAVETTNTVLTADPTSAWMSRCDNPWHIQGFWYGYTDGYSSINVDWSGADSGKFCASGTLDQQTDGQWGAAIAFWVCQTTQNDGDIEDSHPLSECPWDMSGFTGISATISGTISQGNEVRISFRQANSSVFPFISADPTGSSAQFDFSDATWPYDTSAPGLNVDDIQDIEFEFSTSPDSAGDFDICVSDISFY